jgi:hypothetical protein
MDWNVAVVLAIFMVTYGLIAFRRVGKFEPPVWTAMLVGAALMILSGSISVEAALCFSES